MVKRPEKPYPEFPLTAHPRTRKWVKKIGGSIRYFGTWDEPQLALDEFAEQFPDAFAEWKRNNQVVPVVTKPATDKPRPDFPLWRCKHTGRWAKKIHGKLWRSTTSDPAEAEQEYFSYRHFLANGGAPAAAADTGWTIGDVINDRLDLAKKDGASQAHWNKLLKIGRRVLECPGWDRLRRFDSLSNDDLQALRGHLSTGTRVKRVSLDTLAGHMEYALMFLRHGKEKTGCRLDLKRHFKKPSRDRVAAERHARGKEKEFFEPDQIHLMLGNALPFLKAMILLGINGGFENAQCANLPISDIDFAKAEIATIREKTQVLRRVPLWPETIAAIKDYQAVRPDPKPETSKYLFVTRLGTSYHAKLGDDKPGTFDPIGLAMRRLLEDLGIKRPGVNFKALRHTFQTIGDTAGNTVAVKIIMGHKYGGISDTYRQRACFPRETLELVTDKVHAWLFG